MKKIESQYWRNRKADRYKISANKDKYLSLSDLLLRLNKI